MIFQKAGTTDEAVEILGKHKRSKFVLSPEQLRLVRARTILAYKAAGISSKQIAALLNQSETTISGELTFLRRLREKKGPQATMIRLPGFDDEAGEVDD